MQSKFGRYVLGRTRRNWSKTMGYDELHWLTLQQSAVECSLRLLFKVLWTKRPATLHSLVYDEHKEILFTVTDQELGSMTKLSRKTWKIRVLRYAQIVPEELFQIDPLSNTFRSCLKQWVKNNIPQEGDYILKGRINTKEEAKVVEDWLESELDSWKKKENHDIHSNIEFEELLAEDREFFL